MPESVEAPYWRDIVGCFGLLGVDVDQAEACRDKLDSAVADGTSPSGSYCQNEADCRIIAHRFYELDAPNLSDRTMKVWEAPPFKAPI